VHERRTDLWLNQRCTCADPARCCSRESETDEVQTWHWGSAPLQALCERVQRPAAARDLFGQTSCCYHSRRRDSSARPGAKNYGRTATPEDQYNGSSLLRRCVRCPSRVCACAPCVCVPRPLRGRSLLVVSFCRCSCPVPVAAQRPKRSGQRTHRAAAEHSGTAAQAPATHTRAHRGRRSKGSTHLTKRGEAASFR